MGWVKFVKLREIEGKILNVIVSRIFIGKYFILICCSVDKIEEKFKIDRVIGIDLGINYFLIDSDGNKIFNFKYFIKLEKRFIRE